MKIKVGITGQAGFVGTHLFNTLNLDKENFETIPFKDSVFLNTTLLEDWVSKCDAIVHLAALNRHNDPNVVYDTNIFLVKQLIAALENTNSIPALLFSSSIQEDSDNLYGKSKKEGRKLLECWAQKYNAKFTGLVIPNVFGPFGIPFYNSVVATFCFQLTHNEQPKIDFDGELKLLYVGDLVTIIIKQIKILFNKNYKNAITDTIKVKHTSSIKVSDLLRKIENYKILYIDSGIIPNLNNEFDKNLFNTFICYIDHKNFYPHYLTKNADIRGFFIEIMKLNSGGQISFSTTIKGITRGNHFHTRKFERFTVIKGKALIEIRKINTNEVLSFELDGVNPSFVDIPIWYTHNIKNIGIEKLYTIFWINEIFNPKNSDTYIEEVKIN